MKKVALVTGASSGIGVEYARELAERGYDLVIVSNEAERLRTVAEELSRLYSVEVEVLYLDLATPDAAWQLVEQSRRAGWEVEVLINNAGIFRFQRVVNLPVEMVEKMLLLHVVTPAMLCRYFGEEMKKRQRGYILNMSSLSAWLPYPGISLYASTKCFLKSFSRAFRLEMLTYGVQVTVLCSGAIATDLYSLDKRLQRLGIRLGIIMLPKKLARKAIRGLFKGRAWMMPGWFNYLFVGILILLPLGVVRWMMRSFAKI